MTTGKTFKRAVRRRADRTGEPYTTARMVVLRSQAGPGNGNRSHIADALNASFDAQIDRLIEAGYAERLGHDPDLFRTGLEPLRAATWLVLRTQPGLLWSCLVS